MSHCNVHVISHRFTASNAGFSCALTYNIFIINNQYIFHFYQFDMLLKYVTNCSESWEGD